MSMTQTPDSSKPASMEIVQGASSGGGVGVGMGQQSLYRGEGVKSGGELVGGVAWYDPGLPGEHGPGIITEAPEWPARRS